MFWIDLFVSEDILLKIVSAWLLMSKVSFFSICVSDFIIITSSLSWRVAFLANIASSLACSASATTSDTPPVMLSRISLSCFATVGTSPFSVVTTVFSSPCIILCHFLPSTSTCETAASSLSSIFAIYKSFVCF